MRNILRIVFVYNFMLHFTFKTLKSNIMFESIVVRCCKLDEMCLEARKSGQRCKKNGLLRIMKNLFTSKNQKKNPRNHSEESDNIFDIPDELIRELSPCQKKRKISDTEEQKIDYTEETKKITENNSDNNSSEFSWVYNTSNSSQHDIFQFDNLQYQDLMNKKILLPRAHIREKKAFNKDKFYSKIYKCRKTLFVPDQASNSSNYSNKSNNEYKDVESDMQQQVINENYIKNKENTSKNNLIHEKRYFQTFQKREDINIDNINEDGCNLSNDTISSTSLQNILLKEENNENFKNKVENESENSSIHKNKQRNSSKIIYSMNNKFNLLNTDEKNDVSFSEEKYLNWDDENKDQLLVDTCYPKNDIFEKKSIKDDNNLKSKLNLHVQVERGGVKRKINEFERGNMGSTKQVERKFSLKKPRLIKNNFQNEIKELSDGNETVFNFYQMRELFNLNQVSQDSNSSIVLTHGKSKNEEKNKISNLEAILHDKDNISNLENSKEISCEKHELGNVTRITEIDVLMNQIKNLNLRISEFYVTKDKNLLNILDENCVGFTPTYEIDEKKPDMYDNDIMNNREQKKVKKYHNDQNINAENNECDNNFEN